MTIANPNPTPGQQASVIIHGLLGEFFLDIVNSGTGILETSAQSLSATPTAQNLLAQGAAIALAAPLALPTLESASLSQFATAFSSLIALAQQQAALVARQLTPVQSPASTVAVPRATPAGS